MSGEALPPRRFEVALSFPGEHRTVVEAVANLLSGKLTQERVLYDEYHDAEFAAPDLDIYLPSLYLEHSELIVVFLCPEYSEKRWCKLEWRHIREMVATADSRRIMFVSFGKMGRIPELGILEGDGKLDATGKSPEEITAKILKRLHLNQEVNPTTNAFTTASGVGHLRLPQPRHRELFTGRENDIRDIISNEFSTPYSSGDSPLVLHGPPGVGKTTLACELLYRLHDQRLLTRIFYIPASDPSSLPTFLADIAVVLGLFSRIEEPVDPSTSRIALLQWLGAPANLGKALFYFDNADSPAARDAVLAEIKSLGYPRAVVTSRRNDWVLAHCHLVTSWTPDQAAEYLRKGSAQISEADIQLLTSALGGLPLAFFLAAGLIRTRHYPASELLSLWRAKLPDLQISDRDGKPTITALLAVSLDTLDEDAQTLLQILSFYAPQPIPEKLIGACDIEKWRESLGELNAASLLDWECSDSTITLHPFIREAIHQAIPAAIWEVFLDVSSEMLSRYLPPPNWTPDRWQEWPLLLPHCQEFVRHAGRPDLAPDHSSLWVPPAVRVINELAMYYCERAAFQEAEPLLREALRLDRSKYGNHHPEVAIRLNNLSSTLIDAKKNSEAELLMREALQIHRDAYGDNHEQVARVLNNLAQLLQATNRQSEAEPLMREGLEIERSSKGNEHPHVAIQLSNLAQLLRSTSRLSEAEPLLREAIQISRSSLGGDHPQVAGDLSNLALLLYETDRLSEAEPMMRDALRIDRAAYGEDHPRVANNLNNLACLLQAENRLPEAEPVMWDLLRIDQDKYGEDHPHVTRDRYNLILLLQATNRLEEAEPLLSAVLRNTRVVPDENDPSVAIRLNRLAYLLHATNRHSEAEPLLRDAVRILNNSLGSEHPNTVAVSQNLEILLDELKNLTG